MFGYWAYVIHFLLFINKFITLRHEPQKTSRRSKLFILRQQYIIFSTGLWLKLLSRLRRNRRCCTNHRKRAETIPYTEDNMFQRPKHNRDRHSRRRRGASHSHRGDIIFATDTQRLPHCSEKTDKRVQPRLYTSTYAQSGGNAVFAEYGFERNQTIHTLARRYFGAEVSVFAL